MITRIALPDNLYECPQPWINFIEDCQDRCPQERDIERYVDNRLLTKYLSTVDDENGCVIFTSREFYTLFLMEWT